MTKARVRAINYDFDHRSNITEFGSPVRLPHAVAGLSVKHAGKASVEASAEVKEDPGASSGAPYAVTGLSVKHQGVFPGDSGSQKTLEMPKEPLRVLFLGPYAGHDEAHDKSKHWRGILEKVFGEKILLHFGDPPYDLPESEYGTCHDL